MGAGSNAQAWAGRGTGAQIIRTGTVFQCAPTAADPAAAVRGELTEVGAEREVQHWAEIFRQAMCAARSCISIQQARLTMHGGKFLPAGFADAGDLALVRQLTEADTADAVLFQYGVRSSADLASGICTCGKLRFSLLFYFERCFSHRLPPSISQTADQVLRAELLLLRLS